MAFLVAEYGRARGFEAIDAFHFITPVNGILSVNAKGSGQLLFQNKYVIKEIHRAAYIYAAHGKEFISPRLLAVDEVMWALGINNEEFVEFDEAKKARISTARDRITEIHYGFRGNDGKVVWEGEFKYYYSQINAELLAKSTYQNYLPDMMLHRAKVGLSKVLGVLTGSDSEEVASLGNSNYIDIVEGEVTVMP